MFPGVETMPMGSCCLLRLVYIDIGESCVARIGNAEMFLLVYVRRRSAAPGNWKPELFLLPLRAVVLEPGKALCCGRFRLVSVAGSMMKRHFLQQTKGMLLPNGFPVYRRVLQELPSCKGGYMLPSQYGWQDPVIYLAR